MRHVVRLAALLIAVSSGSCGGDSQNSQESPGTWSLTVVDNLSASFDVYAAPNTAPYVYQKLGSVAYGTPAVFHGFEVNWSYIIHFLPAGFVGDPALAAYYTVVSSDGPDQIWTIDG
jgi:hypothetical protein